MPSLNEIGLEQSIRGFFLRTIVLSDGRACEKKIYGNPEKNYRCALRAKSWQINDIQAHS